MPVFNLFLKIVKAKKYMLLMYYGIFLSIFFLISNTTQKTDANAFQETSISIGIAAGEDTLLTQGIAEYLGEHHKVSFINSDKKAMQKALYGPEITYLIRIPEGFTQSFLSQTNDPLEVTSSPLDVSYSYLVNAQLENYLGNVHLYLTGGQPLSQALTKAASLDSLSTDISFQDGKKLASQGEMPGISYYYRYFTYVALCVMLTCACPVLVVFYQPDVYRRCACSSMKLRSHNTQLALGMLSLALFVLISLNLIGFIYGFGSINSSQALYLILNTTVFTLVSSSLAYLCGFIAKNDMAVSGLSNVISLSFCFLGGVFVSLDMISSKVQIFSRLLPTYWYTIVNQTIFTSNTLNSAQQTQIFQGMAIQLVFAAAVCSAALLLSRRKQQFITH